MNINSYDMFNQIEDIFNDEQTIGDLLRGIYGEDYRTQEELTMENNMTKEPTMYECPTCHKKYASITDMANCILRDEKTKSEKQIKLESLDKKILDVTKNLDALTKEYNTLSGKEVYHLNVERDAKTDVTNCNKACSCGDKNCNNKEKPYAKAKVYTIDDDTIEEWLKEFSKELASGSNLFTKWIEN